MISVSMHLSAIVSRPTPRRGLPEHTNYRDTGCYISESCLNCPLPVCRYDMPTKRPRPDTVLRRTRILQHTRLGRRPNEIAAIEGTCMRTVYNTLRLARREGVL